MPIHLLYCDGKELPDGRQRRIAGGNSCRENSVSVKETVLDNGLKVLIQEVHTAPLASVWCWYRVGSKDEGPGVTGVSHWCEHMNFKGTHNIPRDQVKGIIEKFGGSLERLHLDRSDDVPRNRLEGRARSHAVHRGRAHGRLSLRSRRLRVGAHRDHLRAAGRRERSRAAARHRSDRRRVQGPSVSPSDDRLADGSARR